VILISKKPVFRIPGAPACESMWAEIILEPGNWSRASRLVPR
jgi:hypothetical protein